MAAVKRLLLALLFVPIVLGTAQAQIAGNSSFPLWLQELEQEAIEDGITPETTRAALENVEPDDHVLELDGKQPETTITFADYVRRTVTPGRISEGRELLQANAAILNAVADRYGVQPPIIVALWGIESSYGQRSGDFAIIDSLVTLAYAGRRADFFRKELINALHILDRQHIPASSLLGSWAGAMGQCQFMPSTYLHYAASYTGNGAPDIWENTSDVFASIANYLAAEGWRSDEGWGHEVRLHQAVPEEETGLGQSHSLAEWKNWGVGDSNIDALGVESARTASLIAPDGPDGRHFLVYDNFRALMRWNRSTFFAASVGLLADRIADDR